MIIMTPMFLRSSSLANWPLQILEQVIWETCCQSSWKLPVALKMLECNKFYLCWDSCWFHEGTAHVFTDQNASSVLIVFCGDVGMLGAFLHGDSHSALPPRLPQRWERSLWSQQLEWWMLLSRPVWWCCSMSLSAPCRNELTDRHAGPCQWEIMGNLYEESFRLGNYALTRLISPHGAPEC